MARKTRRKYESVREQAANWVVLLHTRTNIEPILPLFSAWLDAGPTHQPEFARLDALWQWVEDLRDSGRLGDVNSLLASMPAPPRPLLPPSSWRRPVGIVTSALVLLSVLVSVYRFDPWHHSVHACEDPQPEHHLPRCSLSRGQHATDYGQPATLDLVDGSRIDLDSNSQVILDLAGNHRMVRLDRGEALFHVAKDRAAPFEVSIGSVTVRSLGTTFSVEKEGPDTAQTVVLEGKVAILREHEKPFLVEEGQVAEIRDGRVQYCKPTPSKVDARLSWTAGLLSFNGETLAQAAQKFNRYNRRKLQVDTQIAAVPIGGLFPSSNPDGFANAIGRMLGVEHIFWRNPKTGEEVIFLRGKKPPDPSYNTGQHDSLETHQ